MTVLQTGIKASPCNNRIREFPFEDVVVFGPDKAKRNCCRGLKVIEKKNSQFRGKVPAFFWGYEQSVSVYLLR